MRLRHLFTLIGLTASFFLQNALPLAAEKQSSSPRVLSPKRFHEGFVRKQNLVPSLLADFANTPGCNGESLADGMIRLMETEAGMEISARSPFALEDGQTVASDLNRLAEVAAANGCPELARKLYLQVVEDYVGSGYAAMRQRAQIGIDDLRAQAQTSPTTAPEEHGVATH